MISSATKSNGGAVNYWQHLIDYLNSIQYENGLWEPDVTYNSTNGLMKISAIYSYASTYTNKAPIPRAAKAIEACMIITKDTVGKGDGWDHACDTYNPWYTMDILLDTVAVTEGSAKVSDLRKII